jgi:hypothetical protein
MLWAFDIQTVYDRSILQQWIADCDRAKDMQPILDEQRQQLKKDGNLLPVENFPLHEDMRGTHW